MMARETSKRVRSAVVTRIVGRMVTALSAEIMIVTLKKEPLDDEELLSRIGAMAALMLNGAKIDAAEAAEDYVSEVRKFAKGHNPKE
jgi:hypothetical protein